MIASLGPFVNLFLKPLATVFVATLCYNSCMLNKKVNNMLVNKCEGRGGVTQIEMTVCEVIQEMVDNWFFEEDTLTGGVETVSYTHLTLPTKRIV